MRATIAGFAAVCLPLLVNAADPLHYKTPVIESIDKTRRVSGDALVGLAHLPLGSSDQLQKISTALRGFTGELELLVRTADGRYHAKIYYSANRDAPNIAELTLPPSTLNWLAREGYNAQNTAMLLREVGGRHKPFPLLWNNSQSSDRVRAYINSERTSGFVLDYTIKKRVACASLAGPSLIFDQVCTFPSELLARDFVEIERKDGLRVLSPIKIAVYK